MATLLETLQLQSAAALARLIENPAIDPDTTPPAVLVEEQVMQMRGVETSTSAPTVATPPLPLPVDIEPTDPATMHPMPAPKP